MTNISQKHECSECGLLLQESLVRVGSYGPTGTEVGIFSCLLCEVKGSTTDIQQYISWLEDNVQPKVADLVHPNQRIRKRAQQKTRREYEDKFTTATLI